MSRDREMCAVIRRRLKLNIHRAIIYMIQQTTLDVLAELPNADLLELIQDYRKTIRPRRFKIIHAILRKHFTRKRLRRINAKYRFVARTGRVLPKEFLALYRILDTAKRTGDTVTFAAVRKAIELLR